MQCSQGISQCRTRLRKPILPGPVPRFKREIFRNEVGRQANKIEFCLRAWLPLPHTLDECNYQLAGKWLLGALVVKSIQFPKELDSRSPGQRLDQIGDQGDKCFWMAQVQQSNDVRAPVSTTQDWCSRHLHLIAG